jgi:hypothetical protein
MRYFLTARQPEESRILLVESGSRFLLEGPIPGIRSTYGQDARVDLLTCYPGRPAGFDTAATDAIRIADYRGDWRRLVRELRSRRYTIVGIICSAEPVMTKWKWLVALALPAKVFVLNENGDYFWFDRVHFAVIRHFALYRMGLAGAGAVRTIARLALFPLTLLYLLCYAAAAHTRRRIHLARSS